MLFAWKIESTKKNLMFWPICYLVKGYDSFPSTAIPKEIMNLGTWRKFNIVSFLSFDGEASESTNYPIDALVSTKF